MMPWPFYVCVILANFAGGYWFFAERGSLREIRLAKFFVLMAWTVAVISVRRIVEVSQ